MQYILLCFCDGNLRVSLFLRGDRRDPLVERNSLRGPQITVFILAFNCEKENFSIVIEKHTKKRDCFVRAMEKRARFPKCFLCCLFVDWWQNAWLTGNNNNHNNNKLHRRQHFFAFLLFFIRTQRNTDTRRTRFAVKNTLCGWKIFHRKTNPPDTFEFTLQSDVFPLLTSLLTNSEESAERQTTAKSTGASGAAWLSIMQLPRSVQMQQLCH